MNIEKVIQLLSDIEQRIGEIRSEVGAPPAGAGLQASATAETVVQPKVIEILELPGAAADRTKEIVGGVVTTDFPDCCAVGNAEGYYCSGTLIAPNVVVTADHCHNITQVFLAGNDVFEPHHGETIPVAQAYSHPEVDLKVLVLRHAANVQPRHVAQGVEVGAPEEAVVAGFGTTNLFGTEGYGIKRMARVPIMSASCSVSTDAKQYGCVPEREIVAGHLGLQRDTCQGDSGGPLYIQAPERSEFYLLGATSRGARGGFTSCGDGGIYVRGTSAWIGFVT